MSEVQQIKDALSIVDVVSRYVELKKAGINYTGLCPFHNEKTPSFYVSPDRGTFKCFGCGEGGDIFTFMEKIEGMEFREVLEKYADETGIVLSKQIKQSGPNRSQKDHYLAILEHARIFWQKQLAVNPQAIEYLKQRGFTKMQVLEFQIGYAPDGWESLKSHLLAQGVSEEDMETVGLVKMGERGNRYDRFRDRIVFPLRNMAGKSVAFSGRYIGSDDVSAKYLNSPETPVFNKSKELYGIDTAKAAMRKNNFAIVVEGQVDLVMGQSVYPNTVATSGTSLTRDHLQMIRRFADRVIFVFDSDQAGMNASHKAALLALSLDFEVRVVDLPQGKDPADIIVEDIEVYRKYIKEAKDVFDYWIHHINVGNSPRERNKMIEEKIFPLLLHHANALEQDRYIQHIAKGLAISPDAIRQRLGQMQTHRPVVGPEGMPAQPEDESHLPQQEPETVVERLALVLLWQQQLSGENQWVDTNAIKQKIDTDDWLAVAHSIEQWQSSENLTQRLFEIEKLYENSIMLQNDINELVTNLSTYRDKTHQNNLMNQYRIAKSQGDTEQAKKLLQEIHNSIVDDKKD